MLLCWIDIQMCIFIKLILHMIVTTKCNVKSSYENKFQK